MKKIITAIGNEELNNILREQKGIAIQNSDIQYQEGIIEALDKYPNTDIIVLHEDIIGTLDIDELILSIVLIKSDIEIILISEKYEYIKNKNIKKLVTDKENYIDIIAKEIVGENYIKPKKTIERIEEKIDNIKQEEYKISINPKIKQAIKSTVNKIKEKYMKVIQKLRTKEKNIIIVIGSAGVRKNNFYWHISKTNRIKENFNYRF